MMQNRICLSIAILAGLAAIGLGWVNLRANGLALQAGWNREQQLRRELTLLTRQAQREGEQLQATLKREEEAHRATRAALATAQAGRQQAEAQAQAAAGELAKTQSALTRAQLALAPWDVLNLRPEQVKALQAELQRARQDNAALTAEAQKLARETARLSNIVALLVGPWDDTGVEPPLPAGLKGRVLAVDPKWNFVVLDVGRDQGALPNGVMLVNREGKLIAKVKIRQVQEDRCIANVLPGFTFAPIREGDQVLN
jgi:hypothetical protein